MARRRWALALVALIAVEARGEGPPLRIGAEVERRGDEIVVAGRRFHTTTPVVLWTDPGGYDAYRVERRFAPIDEASWKATAEAKGQAFRSPNRYGMRTKGLSVDVVERVRGGGWDLETLREIVDQFVIHFDVAGTSKKCFQVLHDERDLSVQFMLDLDGTVYQTLDLKEGAWHATIANTRSVGIEIANVGAYPPDRTDVFTKWYAAKTPDGHTALTIPGGLAQSGLRDLSVPLRPSRDEPVVGEVQGQTLHQYDLTPRQYEALIKLTATLCTIFPKITCDYPRDVEGRLIPRKLSEDAYKTYRGVLGHYHVQTNKVDPGPAFQWDKVIDGARKLMDK